MTQVELETTLHRKTRDAEALLARVAQEYRPAALATSFGVQGMVLIDVICRLDLDLEIFTLDTGRLPGETYALMQTVQERYGRRIRVMFPQREAVEAFVEESGINAFYRGVDLRKRCCDIRKVEPLNRALEGKRAWLTGLRRDQALTRRDMGVEEWDQGHGMPKFNPLIDWSEDDVWNYVRAFDVPYNTLHDAGYPSIGCAPCTRAITAGEDIRAGRWWWEQPENKECGLHVGSGSGR